MDFLKYSNETHSNIVPKKEFMGLVEETFHIISENLCKSLGPLGSSATILDGMITEATKDGYSILKNYRFRNRYKRMVYSLIKTPCTKMNNTVGDGTTTAIALTDAMFMYYKSREGTFETLYRLPRTFINCWDYIINNIVEMIKEKSTPIDPDDYDTIYNIAYVTSNGNKEISENFAQIYSESKTPTIKKKESPSNKCYVQPIEGFDFPCNLIDVAYARNQDLSAEEKNIYVMVFDHTIETDLFKQVIMPINEVVRAMGHKLLIVAPSFDEYMCETELKKYVNYEHQKYRSINLIMSKYSLSKLSDYQKEDLCVVLKCNLITKSIANKLVESFSSQNSDSLVNDILSNKTNDLYGLIGESVKANLSCNNGSIFKVKNINSDKRYKDTLNKANAELNDIINNTSLERSSYSAKIYEAKNRIGRLQMKNYIYYIGANSELQRQVLEDSVDDVIKCLQSATKYGIVPGCQITIYNCSQQLGIDLCEGIDMNAPRENLPADLNLKVEILSLIMNSIRFVYSKILHGPDGVGIIKTIDGWENVTKDNISDLQDKAINKGYEIIDESFKLNKVFDLETLTYNESIITSAETDIMVLTVASELIKILISGNQCVFLDSEIDESHEETKEYYM